MEINTQKAITLNYNRMMESREKNEPVLERLFETRMNRALDSHIDIHGLEQSIGEIAIEDLEQAA